MKEKSLKPRIRFKGFTEAWEQRKLDQVASYRNGKAHENSIDPEGNYIVVNSKFVSTDGEVVKKSNEQIEPLYKNELAFVLSDVPNGRAIARTFLVQKDGLYTLNQRIAGITPLNDTYPYFLHILMNRNKYFLAFDDGAKQTNLSVKDVIEFEANYPSFKEQERIGVLFDSLDALITLHQRKLEKLSQIKKSLLEKMFPTEGATTPKIRFKGFSEAWEQRKLEESCDIYLGLTYTPEYSKEGIKFISSKDISNDYLDLSDTKYISKEEYRRATPNAKPVKGDILFTRVGSNLGHSALIETNEKLCIFVSLGYLRCKNNINNHFVKHWLNSPDFEKQLFQRTGGGAKTNVNTGWLKSFDFKIANKVTEQDNIGAFFDNIDNLITLHQRKYEKLKNIKKSLLEKMYV